MKKYLFLIIILVSQLKIFCLETFDIDLYERDVYEKSLEFQTQNKLDLALQEIETIPDLSNNYKARILYIKLLFVNEKYDKLIEEIKKSQKYFLQKGINSISYEIIVSYANMAKLEELRTLISEIGSEKVKDSVGILLVKYLQEKDYEKYLDVINKLQNMVFDSDEKLLLRSIYFYYKKDYKKAIAGFSNLKNKSGNVKDISEHYLSLIQFYTKENILEFNDGFENSVKQNLIVYESRNADFRHISSLNKFNTKLYYNLLAYKYFHEKKYQLSLNTLKYEENSFYYFLLAESEQKMKDYKLAIKHYKYLKNRKLTQQDYLNYAIGNCYYQLFKYNNSAYYWMKMLYSKDNNYKFTGLKKLSKLYTFTKHYEYAIPYYQSLLDKYSYRNKKYVRAFFRIILKEKRRVLLEEYFTKYKKLLDKGLRSQITLFLGKQYEEEKLYEKAIKYYREFLKLQKDDEIEFKICYLKYKLDGEKSYEDFLKNFVFTHPNNSLNKQFALDLLKFYLKKEEYSKTINIINDLDSVSVKLDSLNYFKAIALNGLNKWNESSEILYKMVRKDSVYNSYYRLYEFTLKNMDAKNSIEFLNTKLDSTNNLFLRKREILALSEIYDKNRLFHEAIQNYEDLLKDTTLTLSKKEVYEINIKIATDYIVIKKYQKAIDTLNLIYQKGFRGEELDYLMFVAYAAKKDTDMQKKYLLDYFFNYQNGNEFDLVALKLIQIYSQEDKNLLAWIIYKEVLKTKSKDFKTIAEIEKLRNNFKTMDFDSLLYYQVQPIKKVFFWENDKNQN